MSHTPLVVPIETCGVGEDKIGSAGFDKLDQRQRYSPQVI